MKPRTLICKHCKKPFTTTAKAQKFCSVMCRYKFSQIKRCEEAGYEYMKKRRGRESLCWDCKNACGGCSWSRNLTPVEGWEAKTIKVKGNFYTGEVLDSYVVINCPEFIEG